eukprot:5400274-Amphidinium_carterae.1
MTCCAEQLQVWEFVPVGFTGLGVWGIDPVISRGGMVLLIVSATIGGCASEHLSYSRVCACGLLLRQAVEAAVAKVVHQGAHKPSYDMVQCRPKRLPTDFNTLRN